MDNIVVLDCGSETFKAGFTHNFPNEQEPRIVAPAAVKYLSEDSNEEHQTATDNAVQVVQAGSVAHWDGFEAILNSILFDQLGWERGNEGGILLAEPLLLAKADREQLTQLLFENFNLDGLFLCDAPVLALYAVGKVTGCVVDIGHDKSDVAVVLDGQVSSSSVRRLHGGMVSVAAILSQLVTAAHSGLTPSQQSVRQLLTSCIQVSEEAGNGTPEPGQEDMSTTHTLPDGQTFTLQAGEGRRLGEVMLQGAHLGLPLPDAIFSACACHLEPATRKAALEALLVCGGGSAVPGVGPRLLRELRSRTPASLSPQLLLPPDYMPSQTLRFAAWMGGAILAKVVFQQNQHMTKYDYDEAGPMAVHRKCC